MSHTPEKAKELWCPMVRIARQELVEFTKPLGGGYIETKREHHLVAGNNSDAIGGNRVPKSCCCIADKCAMWRWSEFKMVTKPEVVEDASMGPGGKRIAQVGVREPVAGHCGLAGRSEVIR